MGRAEDCRLFAGNGEAGGTPVGSRPRRYCCAELNYGCDTEEKVQSEKR